MPPPSDQLGLGLAVGLGLALIAWYLVGNELMRRRARRLALWSKRVVDPLGGQQSVRWFSQQAFRLEVERTRAPFQAASITGLVESWDVPMVWLWNRLHGRRDMVLVQLQLRRQPLWGFEVYRPGSLLAGDAHHFARQEGWDEERHDEFMVAAAGPTPRKLAAELLAVLEAERARLVRLAVRRQGTHLTLALNVGDPTQVDAREVTRLLERLSAAAVPT